MNVILYYIEITDNIAKEINSFHQYILMYCMAMSCNEDAITLFNKQAYKG